MKTRPLIPAQSPETLMDAPAFNQIEEDFRNQYDGEITQGHIDALPTEEEVLTATLHWKAPAQLLNPPVMIPLEQFIGILEQIREGAHHDSSEFGSGWLEGLQTAIERVHETATGQPFEWNPKPAPTNDDGLILPALDPFRETGYEEVNEEFTLMWEGLTSASAPLLAFLRLKLATWFTQNKTDITCGNIATDYYWNHILVAFPEFKVAQSGKNYVDIESRESDTGLTIRITQDYHYDPHYQEKRFTRLRGRS